LLPYKLKIRAPRSVHALPPVDLGRAETWRDANDNICAYGYVAERRCWMHFPGFATYRFSATRSEVTAFPMRPGRTDVVCDVYQRSVLPMVMQVQGHEVLHASAVLHGGELVAFCGRSGAGKSTIAYGLSRRGYRQWADDTVALRRVDGRVRTIALPFGVRLRPGPARYFGLPSKRELPLPVLQRPSRRRASSMPLSTLFVLEQVDRASAECEAVAVRPLAASEFFTAVLPHAYCFSLHSLARKRRMIRQYLDFGSRMRTFRIRFAGELARLPAVLDSIERVIRHP
jgi:hypothetical protein